MACGAHLLYGSIECECVVAVTQNCESLMRALCLMTEAVNDQKIVQNVPRTALERRHPKHQLNKVNT